MGKLTGILLILLVMPEANAEIYKWTDEQGRVHFSDKPASRKAEEVQLQQQNISTSPQLKQDNQQQPYDDTKRRANQSRLGNSLEADRVRREQLAERKKREKARREKNCRYAKQSLQGAKEVGSVFSYDEQGNRHYYNRQQRQEYVQKRQNQVNKWCD